MNTRSKNSAGVQKGVKIPIDGVLDLHTFQPREAKELIGDYLQACRERHILEVRIIHGKGIGALRQTVHAVLRRTPTVIDFRLADETAGGWGATIVRLQPLEEKKTKAGQK